MYDIVSKIHDIMSTTWNVKKNVWTVSIIWNSIKLYEILSKTWNPFILYNLFSTLYNLRCKTCYYIVSVTNPNNLCHWICLLYDCLFPCSLIGRYPAFPIKIKKNVQTNKTTDLLYIGLK